VRSAEGLARARRWEGVRLFAESGLRIYRHSARLQRLATEAREQLAAAPQLALASPPSPLAVAAARDDELAQLTAAEFQARLDEQLRREAWDAAAELISAVRRIEPPWLATIASELDWQDATVACARGDRLRCVQMMGMALKRNRREVERALDFARKYRAAGQHEAALLVARKVVEIVPESGPAKRFLAELEKN